MSPSGLVAVDGQFVVKDTVFFDSFKQPRRRSRPILLVRVTRIR
jgi:hypothetical protein